MSKSKRFKVWVTGGYFDNTGECFVKEIDIFKQTTSDIIRFTPPSNLLVPQKGFTGANWMGKPLTSDLLVCGFCAIFRFSPPDWKLSGILHQPCMNDLHHVAIYDEKIYIVNTGLESIDVFDKSGFYQGSYSFHPAWLSRERQNGITPSKDEVEWQSLLKVGWEERSFSLTDQPPTEDYYQSEKELFHQKKLKDFIHLNHVSILQNQIISTSLSHKCVYNVCNFTKVIDQTPGFPHDGIIHNDNLWITCVDGIIVAYKIKHGVVTNKITYIKNIFEHTEHRGWCRGILIQNNYLIIGITQIYKSTQHYWAPHPHCSTKTGIICFDLNNNESSFINLSERKGKIFSIITN
ncbi:MAG: hypothetical protein OMM_02133 [Candidatus Magnetoglobus multicellularis str. Araruama]|uniref:Uncharacterized protein n=1 Tax=Candidatus Magnetoglobus multicellularis str. Araruama TaxID=890399 RepID=A0A1V1PAT6_9BACT|nr:MAG: hypothetical protein OMM_02133 [Candidatus Magnetoglobus multicellularis str. Araruama]